MSLLHLCLYRSFIIGVYFYFVRSVVNLSLSNSFFFSTTRQGKGGDWGVRSGIEDKSSSVGVKGTVVSSSSSSLSSRALIGIGFAFFSTLFFFLGWLRSSSQ